MRKTSNHGFDLFKHAEDSCYCGIETWSQSALASYIDGPTNYSSVAMQMARDFVLQLVPGLFVIYIGG